jgi:hypothetical protein
MLASVIRLARGFWHLSAQTDRRFTTSCAGTERESTEPYSRTMWAAKLQRLQPLPSHRHRSFFPLFFTVNPRTAGGPGRLVPLGRRHGPGPGLRRGPRGSPGPGRIRRLARWKWPGDARLAER